MEPVLIPAFPEPLLAAMPQLSEKPRLGFTTRNPPWNPGFNVCNSTAAMGLQFACSKTVYAPVDPANNADNGSIWDSCGSSCGAALSTASNFSAGAGDALTFTLDKYPRRAVSWISGMGYGEDVDHGSGAYWAGVGTGTGVGIGLSGPTGPIFGGGKAVTGGTLLNSADSLRIGWSYMRAAGIYRFRVAGTLLGPLVSRGIIASQHINLWPPSTWGW